MSYDALVVKLKEAVLAAEASNDFLTVDETGFILGEFYGNNIYYHVEEKTIPKLSKVINETAQAENRRLLVLRLARRRSENSLIGTVCDLLCRLSSP
jgi:hypothetical protein